MWRALFLILCLAACGRPLTPTERAFAETIHGPSLDTDAVRLHGRNPLYAFQSVRAPRPARTCRERIRRPEAGPVTTRVAATVLYDRIFFAKPFFQKNFLGDYPQGMQLETAMLLAHELTHVWQWQNRRITGYSPWKVPAEHAANDDPYLFEVVTDRSFLDYPYEQQGGLVEEFVCCRSLDPGGARTARLHALLAPVFPALAKSSLVPESNVRTLYADVKRNGICA